MHLEHTNTREKMCFSSFLDVFMIHIENMDSFQSRIWDCMVVLAASFI